MAKTAEQTVKDMAFAEVQTIEKSIKKTVKEIRDSSNEIDRLEVKVDKLHDRHDRQKKSLEKAKRQATDLKRFVWTSDNPNIVELRSELLLAAKLLKDDTVKPKK